MTVLIVSLVIVICVGLYAIVVAAPKRESLLQARQRWWFETRDPTTLPEYQPLAASPEYDEAMRHYGDMKFLGYASEEQIGRAWQNVFDVMCRLPKNRATQSELLSSGRGRAPTPKTRRDSSGLWASALYAGVVADVVVDELGDCSSE